MKKRDVYLVAVYYPDGWEMYGAIKEFDSKDEALKHREKLLAMNHKHVHVWRCVETMIIE